MVGTSVTLKVTPDKLFHLINTRGHIYYSDNSSRGRHSNEALVTWLVLGYHSNRQSLGVVILLSGCDVVGKWRCRGGLRYNGTENGIICSFSEWAFRVMQRGPTYLS